MRRPRAWAVAAVAAASATAGCGDHSPGTGAWPRDPGSARLLSLETRSEVDAGSDKTHYRTMLFGSRGVTTTALQTRAVRHAQARGWRIERVDVDRTRGRAADKIVFMTSPDGRLRASVFRPLSLVYRRVTESARTARAHGQTVIEIELSKR